MEKKRRKFGDRRDGRRVRTLPPMSVVVPYIMRTRNDACNLFSDTIDITETDKFLRDLRRQSGYKNLSMLHVFLAAYIRTICMRPGINRFLSGQRVFHRNTIEVNMTIKREMSIDSPDTMIKVRFEPSDTNHEVYEKFNTTVQDALKENGNDGFESVVGTLSKFPGLFFRLAVDFLYFLDYFDWLPKALLDISPFHGSLIITSMGSLGIPPIIHHLYNFGNLPAFLAYGQKYHENVLRSDGVVERRTMMDVCLTLDERICDGYYYASAFKLFKKFVASPELLLVPPEAVIEDID